MRKTYLRRSNAIKSSTNFSHCRAGPELGLVSRKFRQLTGPVSCLRLIKDRGFNSFASSMIKLSVSETKWSSLLARTRALILCISIWIFDFGPEKLPGLSRNEPLVLEASINAQFPAAIFGTISEKSFFNAI